MTANPLTLVLATTNPGKAREFRALLAPLLGSTQIAIVTPTELGIAVPPVEETGTTFAENARLKAQAFARATGHPALADDSGLCVDALGGAPGLYSARWAGPDAFDADRVALLLRELSGVPALERTARFVCAAALATPDGQTSVTEGVCEGVIAVEPRGSDGFGYDPIFLLPELGRTMAELTSSDKNRLSHRSQALHYLYPHLLAMLFPGTSGNKSP